MEGNHSLPRRATSEHLLLVNILNTMYNDNIRQINQYNNRINSIMETNNRICEMLIQILYANGYGATAASSPRDNYTNQLLISPQYVIDIPLTRQQHRRNGNGRRNGNTIAELIQSFLEPVDVRPTPAQIESATRRARYADITRPMNTQCPISMETFSDDDLVTVIRSCGHIFHTDSLRNWFENNTRCPVCRFDIRDFNVTPHSFYDASLNEVQETDVSGNNVSTLDMLWNVLQQPRPNNRR